MRCVWSWGNQQCELEFRIYLDASTYAGYIMSYISSESKVAPEHDMKAYMGIKSIAAIILKLGNRWKRAVISAPWSL